MAIELVSAGFSLTNAPPLTDIQDGDYVVAGMQDSHACSGFSHTGTASLGSRINASAGSQWEQSSRLFVASGFWHTGETVTFAGACNHWLTGTAIYRGVDPDVPLDGATPQGYDGGKNSGYAMPGITTNTDGARVVCFGSNGNQQYLTNEAAAGLADVTEHMNGISTVGAGGAIWVWDGTKEVAGASGTLTQWYGYSECCPGRLALRAAPEPVGKHQCIIIAS